MDKDSKLKKKERKERKKEVRVYRVDRYRLCVYSCRVMGWSVRKLPILSLYRSRVLAGLAKTVLTVIARLTIIFKFLLEYLILLTI